MKDNNITFYEYEIKNYSCRFIYGKWGMGLGQKSRSSTLTLVGQSLTFVHKIPLDPGGLRKI